MHISGKFKQISKVDIENRKVDIERKKKEYSSKISNKTINYIFLLYSKYKDDYFGRSLVEEVTGLKSHNHLS